MVRIGYHMFIETKDGDGYGLELLVEHPYGREPVTGELVVFRSPDDGDSGVMIAVRVVEVRWFPEYCLIQVEPVLHSSPVDEMPTSPVEQIDLFVRAGFRCPWTGYPTGVEDPDEIH